MSRSRHVRGACGHVQVVDTRVRVRIPLGETSPGIPFGRAGEPRRHVINPAPEIRWEARTLAASGMARAGVPARPGGVCGTARTRTLPSVCEMTALWGETGRGQ